MSGQETDGETPSAIAGATSFSNIGRSAQTSVSEYRPVTVLAVQIGLL